MEAIRVRGTANGDTIGALGLPLEDFELVVAVSAVETGTLNRSASILIQAGFTSRLAAVKAVVDTGATFSNAFELQLWLRSDQVATMSAQADWPTPETKELWFSFTQSFAPRATNVWKEQRFWVSVIWRPGAERPAGTAVRVYDQAGHPIILAADGLPLGSVQAPLNPERRGLLRTTVMEEPGRILLSYLGPEDLWLA